MALKEAGKDSVDLYPKLALGEFCNQYGQSFVRLRFYFSTLKMNKDVVGWISHSSTSSEEPLFSAFVFLTASIETEEYQDDARFNTLSRYRHKDIGVLNKHQHIIGYGSSFYVTCSGNKQDSAVPDSDVLVFKRTIPTVEKEDALKDRKRVDALMRELRVLTHDPIRKPIRKHENIVELLGIAWETDPFDITQKWPQKVSLALDIVLGLKAMHICGVLHGDVKAENALVFANHNVESKEQRSTIIKLADFGGVLFDIPERSTLPSGTRPWNAPEWQTPLPPANLLKTDIYSLGFLVYRVLADGKHPFKGSAAWSDDVGWSKVEAMKANDDQMLEYMCSINGLAGNKNQPERIRSGLKWLKLAAVAGNDGAQAVYSRVCATINEQNPLDDASIVQSWLYNTASRGFFRKLSTRYGGTGVDRFPETRFTIGDVSIDDKKEFDQRLAKAISGLRGLQSSQPLSTAGDHMLHFISCCGLVKSLEVLLKNTNASEVNARNIRSETPLLLACRSGHYKTTMMLSEAGGDPRITNLYGDTPLHWLPSFPDRCVPELTGKFVRSGSNIDGVAQSFSYLGCAARARRRSEFLAQSGLPHQACNEAALPGNLIEAFEKSRDAPKMVDPRSGISYLLSAFMGGSLESPGSFFGRIRRHGYRWKARARETLQVILQHGVQRYPISAAISSRRLESLQLLLQHGADASVREEIPTIAEPVTMLYLCAWGANDDPAFAELLIAKGLDANVDDGPVDYETPFACAVRNRCFRLAELLWRNGADPNAEFNEGLWFSQTTKMTLLGHLVSECSISTLAPLSFLMNLVSRVPPVAQSHLEPAFVVNQSSGKTVLHVMANNVFVRQDSRAEEALLRRITEYFKPDASMLRRRDSATNYTALEQAIIRGNARVVRHLLDQNVSLRSMNGEGETPLDIAQKWLEFFPHETPISDEIEFTLSEKQKVRLRNNRGQIVRTIERYIESVRDDSEQDGTVPK
ncbi:serine/threonine protein kinase [Exophiala aquamarina CBS 119918]|uniref:Serine/threonine protein kinase n=1 Tax=Exophiala aquamarina CBS 119918 TaxID=1182545 RepID=A0A072PE87_9EURO|nr:serine/threonine protein kinase [Exophiala aquamarina CBS 119918]KEF58404.1 serine/threonine protein kinase [Exophiala aquamarina CBS 119918]